MTEAQRAYLADLSIRKGVDLTDTGDKPVAWASEKIEELKAMPDAQLGELTQEDVKKVDKLIEKIKKELHKWTFSQ